MVIRRQGFGSTGHLSSVAVFGAAALGNVCIYGRYVTSSPLYMETDPP